MNKQQIKWASEHDWFICAYDGYERGVVVRDDFEPEKQKVFTDFRKLRVWAGY